VRGLKDLDFGNDHPDGPKDVTPPRTPASSHKPSASATPKSKKPEKHEEKPLFGDESSRGLMNQTGAQINKNLEGVQSQLSNREGRTYKHAQKSPAFAKQ